MLVDVLTIHGRTDGTGGTCTVAHESRDIKSISLVIKSIIFESTADTVHRRSHGPPFLNLADNPVGCSKLSLQEIGHCTQRADRVEWGHKCCVFFLFN